MAIIDPEGLFNGDRLRRCSNTAQLHWTRLFLLADGNARLELNYAKILRAYATFRPVPTEAEIQGYLEEYARNYLLFVYECDGQIWGQFDTKPEYLPRYKTNSDRRSPKPPESDIISWRKRYRDEFKEFPKSFPKLSEAFLTGVGVGVGVGVGKGILSESKKTFDSSAGAKGAPEIENSKSPSTKRRAIANAIDEWFNLQFWPSYPRKDAKKAALQAARKHGATSQSQAAIMAGLRSQIPELAKRERNFIPLASTWLNGERWNDAIEASGHKPNGAALATASNYRKLQPIKPPEGYVDDAQD